MSFVVIGNTGNINAINADGITTTDVNDVTVSNSGSIVADHVGVHDVASSTHDLAELTSFDLVNTAGATIDGVLAGVQVTAAPNLAAVGTFVVDNAGLIESTGGPAIDFSVLAPGDTATITNEGTISGDVLFGAGNDVLNLYTGSSITGHIDGGAGADTINLLGTATGTGTLVNVANVENLNVQAGTWSITDTESFQGGTAISPGATLQLGIGGTTGALTGNVVDNGTFALDHSNTIIFDGIISGSGIVEQMGTGTASLAGHNTFTGGTDIFAGTLDIVTTDGAGTGAITFEAGAQTLRVEDTALSGDHFANTIDGFSNQSTIDLGGIGTATNATLDANNNVLTISGGTEGPMTLNLDPTHNFAGDIFAVSPDGTGGTDVRIVSQVISAGNGKNVVTGTPGNDFITVGNGNNVINSGDGNDMIITGNGKDVINAGNGNNIISLGNGNDTVQVGTGSNILNAGNGHDTFVFGPVSGQNVINGFGHSDQVEFNGGVFANFQAVLAASHQVGAGTVIGVGSGSVTLVGVSLSTCTRPISSCTELSCALQVLLLV